MVINLSNKFIIQWIVSRPTSTGSNLEVSWPTTFTQIYGVSGITGCKDASIASGSGDYCKHDTTKAVAGNININFLVNGEERHFSIYSIIIRRPDKGYVYSYIGTGVKN